MTIAWPIFGDLKGSKNDKNCLIADIYNISGNMLEAHQHRVFQLHPPSGYALTDHLEQMAVRFNNRFLVDDKGKKLSLHFHGSGSK